MSKIENTWRLAPVAAAQHELAEVRAALGFLPQGYTAMAGLERLADLLAAAEPSPTSPAVSTEQDAPITVTVDHDPRGVSVGVWQGSHCIYSGAHPLPAAAGLSTAAHTYGAPAEVAVRIENYLTHNGQENSVSLLLYEAMKALRAPAAADVQTAAARDVLAERQRQISVEGRTPAHDDQYTAGDMASAAACYAAQGRHHYPEPGRPGPSWPWAAEWWKPSTYRRNLEKAGALILAEIERLDRAAQRAGMPNGPALQHRDQRREGTWRDPEAAARLRLQQVREHGGRRRRRAAGAVRIPGPPGFREGIDEGLRRGLAQGEPVESSPHRHAGPVREKAMDVASVAVYSILRDWIKGQIMAIETGILSFEGAFLGQIMLPTGHTVLEHAAAANLLPAPDGGQQSRQAAEV